MSKHKTCFVIAPIGEEGSEIRKRSDQVFKHVISPVAETEGYRAEMAHHVSEPGSITTQIIDRILNADLVIADLTGHNANVLYELAVRHVVKKPVVQIIQRGEKLPFDISQQRTISLDHRDLDSVEEAKEALTKQIRSVQNDPSQVDSPISIAVNLTSLKGSENPENTALAEIMSMLQEIRTEQRFLSSASQMAMLNYLRVAEEKTVKKSQNAFSALMHAMEAEEMKQRAVAKVMEDNKNAIANALTEYQIKKAHLSPKEQEEDESS